MLKIKRIYEKYDKSDGFRILVDRLWPRGVSKKDARIDLWLKEISPTNELREWFNHDPIKWEEFQIKYTKELAKKEELIEQIKKIVHENKQVTLVYAASDELHNNAIALFNYLTKE